jgi:hypothetical protein
MQNEKLGIGFIVKNCFELLWLKIGKRKGELEKMCVWFKIFFYFELFIKKVK